MYVYMCTLMNISEAVCVYVNVHILCVCMRVCVRVCVCACVWLACEYMSTYVCVGCYCVDGCGIDT